MVITDYKIDSMNKWALTMMIDILLGSGVEASKFTDNFSETPGNISFYEKD